MPTESTLAITTCATSYTPRRNTIATTATSSTTTTTAVSNNADVALIAISENVPLSLTKIKNKQGNLKKDEKKIYSSKTK